MRTFFSSRIFIVIVAFLLFVATFIALLPTLVSTQWGHRQVTAWINRNIPGQIEIEKLHVSWFGGQKIDGLSLRDRQGKLIIDFNKFSTEATLWQLLNKSTHLGHTQLEELNANIVTDEKGISNLQYALGLADSSLNQSIPPSTILLSNVNADLNLFSHNQPLSMRLTGETRQDHLNGSFDIQALLPGVQSESWSQLGQKAQQLLTVEGGKEATLNANVTNFPVDLIDRILVLQNPKMNGLFHSILGDKLNITLNKEPSSDGLAFALNILSPQLQAKLKGILDQKQLSLLAPATFQFNLIPNSINPLIQKQFTLIDPTTLQLILDEVKIPLAFFQDNEDVNECPFGLTAHTILKDNTRIQIPSLGEINLLGLKVDLTSPLCAKTIQVQVQGSAQDNTQKPFDLLFTTTFNKPSHLHKVIAQLQDKAEATLKLTNVPVQLLLSPMQKQQDMLQALVGSTANMEVNIKQTDSNDFDLITSLQTDKITLDRVHLNVNNEIKAMEPIVLKYTLEPKAINNLLADQPFSVVESNPILLTIKNLNIPLNKNEKGIFQSELTTSSIKVIHKPSSHAMELKDFKLLADGSSFNEIALKLSSALALLNPDGTSSPYLGEKGIFNASTQLTFDPEGRPQLNDLKSQFDSDRANVVLEGNLLANNILVLTQPLKAQYKMLPETLEAADVQTKVDFPKIQNIPNLNLKVEPFQVNLKDIQLKSIVIKGNLDIDSLVVQSAPETIVRVDNIDIPWEINSPLNVTLISLKGKASTPQHKSPGKLAVQLLISNWLKEEKLDLTDLKVEVISNMIGLPTSLISLLTVDEDLTPLMGSILDLELSALIDRSQSTPGYWDMVLDSPHLHIKARLMYGEAITLYETTSKSSVDIRWTLTPDGYDFLNKLLEIKSTIKLASPVTFKTYFTDLHIPLTNKTTFLDGAKFSTTLESTDIAWNDTSIPTYKVKGQLHSPNMLDEIDLTLYTTSKESSTINLEAKVSKLFDKLGKKNIDRANMKADLQVTKIPVSMLQALALINASQQQSIGAVIGKELDAQFKVNFHKMEGPLEGYIQGSKGDISLNGKLKKGVLTLEKPFEWNIQFTPELTHLFLKQNMPLLSSALATEEPIKFVIDAKGTEIPLIPFDFEKIAIPKGTLYLGKVRFKNEGELRNIINMLKPIPEDQFIIWFTPIYFQLAQGDMTLKRADMLVADRYSLATWGDMNLKSHKMHLTVGLTEQALRAALGIQGLDSDYILQIPVKGKDGSVEVDKAKVIARISALVAQSQIDGKLKILGNVLDIASNGFQGSGAPEPTTKPLPWQSKMDEGKSQPTQQTNSDTSESDSSKPKNSKERLIKELEKGASSLLDFLK